MQRLPVLSHKGRSVTGGETPHVLASGFLFELRDFRGRNCRKGGLPLTMKLVSVQALLCGLRSQQVRPSICLKKNA